MRPTRPSLLGEGLRLGRSRLTDTGQQHKSKFHSAARSVLRSATTNTTPKPSILRQFTTAVSALLRVGSPPVSKQVFTPLARSVINHSASLHSSGLALRSSVNPVYNAGRFSSHNVGLGTARNFSSGAGRKVLDNVIQNAPLWMRAAADEAGDLKGNNGKKRRRLVNIVKNEERKAKGLPPRAMDKYFSNVDTPEVEEMEVSEVTVLTIPLEPEFTVSHSNSAIHSVLLPSTASLSALHSIYSIHSIRLSNLETKLRASGLWKAADFVEWDFEGMDGKSLRMGWKKRKNKDGNLIGWDKQSIERALGLWEGEERWYSITQMPVMPPVVLTSDETSRSIFEEPLEASWWIDNESCNSSICSTPVSEFSYDSSSDDFGVSGFQSSFISQAEHDLTAATFQFPQPNMSFDHLDLTPTSHPSPLLEHGMDLQSLSEGESCDLHRTSTTPLEATASSRTSSWMANEETYRQGLEEFLHNLNKINNDRTSDWD